jgi:VIT family
MPFKPVLDPMERISEVMFGLVMALTFTCTLGVATADNLKVHSMLVGALGCNLAWGIIDGGIYLLARLNDRGRKILMLHAVRAAPDLDAAQRIISIALPPLLASIMSAKQLEAIRQKLRELPAPAERPGLAKHDLIGALGILLLSFLSTFPIVIPFIFVGDARLALRISNAVAIVMLFICGYLFGSRSGLRPWATGLSMVAVGAALVGVAIALGG